MRLKSVDSVPYIVHVGLSINVVAYYRSRVGESLVLPPKRSYSVWLQRFVCGSKNYWAF